MADELDVIENMIAQEKCAYKTEEGVLAAVILANRNYGLIDKDKLYSLFARRDINGGSRSFITFVLNNAFLESPGVWRFPYPPATSFWMTLYGAIKRYRLNWDKIRGLFDRASDPSERRYQYLNQGLRVTINGLTAQVESMGVRLQEVIRDRDHKSNQNDDLREEVEFYKGKAIKLSNLLTRSEKSLSNIILEFKQEMRSEDENKYQNKDDDRDEDENSDNEDDNNKFFQR